MNENNEEMSDENSELNFYKAVERLRNVITAAKSDPEWQKMVDSKKPVIDRFQPLLTQQHIPDLTETELRPFLYVQNNFHWTGLFRQANRIFADIGRLRANLLKLMDESQPIGNRLDKFSAEILGMGKAISTALLTIAFPEKYGVWNATSETGLSDLGLFPEFKRGLSFGERYVLVNELFTRLARELSIDLWTLDAAWWVLIKKPGEIQASAPVEGLRLAGESEPEYAFGLEKYLHEFIFDNWNQTSLGRDWKIFERPGEPDAGYKLTCGSIGQADLVARHRTAKKWLVIELKRNLTSDAVVGQVLRYMGWVQHHLADEGDEVDGLVIALKPDEKLRYALSAVRNVQIRTYDVKFNLNDVPSL